MQMTLPAGSSLTHGIELSKQAEETLMKNFPEIKHVVAKIGTAEVPTDPMAVEDADIMIVMKPFKEWTSASSRAEMVEKMKASLEPITGAEFNFSQPIQLRFNELMTGAKADIAIKLYGEDMAELYKKAKEASFRGASTGSRRCDRGAGDGAAAIGRTLRSCQDRPLRDEYRGVEHDHPYGLCGRGGGCRFRE